MPTPDPYLSLLQGIPDDKGQQQQLAKGLRRDADFGALGMISGDATLSPFGKGLIKQSNTQATQMGKNRISDNRQKALSKYWDNQDAQQTATNERQTQKDIWQNEHWIRMDELNRLKALAYADAQGKKALQGKDGEGYNKLRTGDIGDLSGMGKTTSQLKSLSGQLSEPDFDPGHLKAPFVRPLANWAAQHGVGSESTMKAQKWWSDLDLFYTLPERNALFGATLTANEQRAWKGASMNEDMTKEQLEEKMATLITVYNDASRRMATGYIEEGYNPKAIGSFMGFDATMLADPAEYADEPIEEPPPDAGSDEIEDLLKMYPAR